MKVDQKILKKTIKHFIFLQPRTTSQKIKEHFNLTYNRDFYTLLSQPDTLKDTIEKFCALCDIETDFFRMIYEVNRDSKVREEKLKREYLLHRDRLAKADNAAEQSLIF